MKLRQVISQGLWDLRTMKLNSTHVLLSLKICVVRFASLRKLSRTSFMDSSWNNLVVIFDVSVFCRGKGHNIEFNSKAM